MRLEVRPVVPSDLPALGRFSERVWDRRHDADFLNWRYLGCPANVAALGAWSGRECVGALSWFERSAVCPGAPRAIRVIFDWYCLPEARGQGVGGALLRSIMQEPRPILCFGGTPDTRARLPHLGWRVIAEASHYLLPLASRPLAQAASRRLHVPPATLLAPAAIAARFWFRRGPATRLMAETDALVPIPPPEEPEAHHDSKDCGLWLRPEPALLHWMRTGPTELGEFEMLAPRRAEPPGEWILLRRHRVRGALAGALLDISPAAEDSSSTPLVARAIARLAAAGVETINACATSGELQGALRQCRFLRRSSFPIHLWSGEGWTPRGPIHLTMAGDDSALLPY